MESMLGVRTDVMPTLLDPHTAADMQDQSEESQRHRRRYQHHFWEPVVEGEVRVPPYV